MFSGAIMSNKIVLDIPLSFHNPAPASLVVADIKLRLSGGAGDENSLDHKALPNRMFWIAFHGSVYPESDKHRQYAMPFAVEGRKSVERVIEFQWDAPETQLEDGHYTPPQRCWSCHNVGAPKMAHHMRLPVTDRPVVRQADRAGHTASGLR